uniref:DUF4781 domain-containing protein n=1 Tax=Panagrolaimus davidi TaxID=227884 RepID=A0A914QU76_9BILA
MTVASFGALAIAVAGLAITVTPIVATAGAGVGAASMIYGGTRAVTTLIDRGQHKQTLAPKDAESRIAWLGIAGAALATGSAQATQALADLATHADKVGKSMEYTVNFVNTSSIGISAIGVVNHGYMIIKNYQEDQTISAFDLMQLSLSALLLTHSLVNFHTAKQIMKDAKTTSLTEFENHLNDKRHRHDFKHVKAALKTIKLDKLKKRPRTIRTVRQIDDPREFFYKAYEITNNDDENRIGNFKFDNNGNFIIGEKKFEI